VNAADFPQLTQRFDVRAVPTDVVVTAGGEVIDRLACPQDPAQYVAQLRAVAARNGFASNSGQPPANTGAPYAQPPQHAQYASGLAMSPYGQQPNAGYTGQPTNPGAQPQTSHLAAGHGPSPAVPNYVGQVGGPQAPPHANQAQPQPRVAANVAAGGNPYRGNSRQYGAGEAPAGAYAAVTSGARGMQPQGPPPSMTGGPQGGRAAGNHSAPSASEPVNRQAANPPAGNPPIGLDGFCPVTLANESKWIKGDVKFGAIHRGRTYLFVGQTEQQQFLAQPDVFSPVLSGFDPVRFVESGDLVQGHRSHGVFFGKQIYLFESEESLQRFWAAPHRYAASAWQAMKESGARR